MEETTQDEQDGESPITPSQEADEKAQQDEKLKAFKAKQVRARGKVRELGIFTIGLGVWLAVITGIAVMVVPDPGGKKILLGLMFGVAAALLVMGVLTIWIRSKVIILITLALVGISLIGDIMLGMNPLKLAVSAAVLYVIGKTGSESLAEVSKYG